MSALVFTPETKAARLLARATAIADALTELRASLRPMPIDPEAAKLFGGEEPKPEEVFRHDSH